MGNGVMKNLKGLPIGVRGTSLTKIGTYRDSSSKSDEF